MSAQSDTNEINLTVAVLPGAIPGFFILIKMGLSRPLFLYFHLFYIVQLTDKFLPMLEFELRISGVRSDRSANCATTTALGAIPG